MSMPRSSIAMGEPLIERAGKSPKWTVVEYLQAWTVVEYQQAWTVVEYLQAWTVVEYLQAWMVVGICRHGWW